MILLDSKNKIYAGTKMQVDVHAYNCMILLDPKNKLWCRQRIIYHFIKLNINCYEWLYEYYERSIIVLCWRLFVTNVYMSIAKDLLLCYS